MSAPFVSGGDGGGGSPSAQIVVSHGSRIFGPFDTLRLAGEFVAELPRPVDARFTYLSDPADWENLLAGDPKPMKVIDGHSRCEKCGYVSCFCPRYGEFDRTGRI